MNFNLRSLPFYLFVIITCLHSCTCSDQGSYEPIRSDEFEKDNAAGYRYKANEILVMYKGKPSPGKRDTIRQALENAGVDSDSVTIRTCNSCNAYVELWQGANIHSVIHDEGIRAGTVSGGSRGVGEDSLARYSLNFIQHLPVETLPTIRQYKFREFPSPSTGIGKDTIVVAVLDTGIDTVHVVRSQYLWKNLAEKGATITDPDSNCYDADLFGWNFISQSPDISDDNLSLHGTLVSDYIVEEFKASTKNFVQIMSLKTHDNQGRGDLFSSICALHYAMDKGANIINASWGFYYYQDDPHPYLDSLITKVMREKGILFITASGNKIAQVDAYAKARYQEQYGVNIPDSLLRNLELHNFYPACLGGADNNVMVATTTNGNMISSTQNYSNRFVDFGVMADTVGPGFMKFQVPFTTDPLFISGSSFATAILSGKIGASTDKEEFRSGVEKANIITNIESGSPGVLQTSTSLDNRNLVRDGRFIKRE
jgi:subtilisin family serine protease